MNYFSSDFHLGHKVITKYRPQFKTIKEHDNAIFAEAEKLTKRDILFILGDFLFDCDNFENYLIRISKLKCRIKLVMGNHDSLKLYTQQIAKNIEIQLPLFSYKNFWVSHCPVHPDELRGRIANIHGHLHNATLDDNRYYDVGLDKNNFKFINWEEIKEVFKNRGLDINKKNNFLEM
jgi:calcineurin-like phosphoesterase family protein